MKLSYSSAARADLRELRRYISKELYNPSSAERIISEIIKSCKRLKDFPMLGVSVSEKYGIDIDARYRLLISGNYIIVYKKRCSNHNSANNQWSHRLYSHSDE